MKSFYSDKKHFKKLKNSDFKGVYKGMATGRICKYAIARFVNIAEYCSNIDLALARAFRVTIKSLTKPEKKLIKILYLFAQSELDLKIHLALMADPAMGNNLKVLALMKGMINDNDVAGKSVMAKLVIGLSDKKTKKPPAKIKEDKANITPLKLVSNE